MLAGVSIIHVHDPVASSVSKVSPFVNVHSPVDTAVFASRDHFRWRVEGPDLRSAAGLAGSAEVEIRRRKGFAAVLGESFHLRLEDSDGFAGVASWEGWLISLVIVRTAVGERAWVGGAAATEAVKRADVESCARFALGVIAVGQGSRWEGRNAQDRGGEHEVGFPEHFELIGLKLYSSNGR